MANILIIVIVSLLGIYGAYVAMALFTKHGSTMRVPGVENMSYTEAVKKLHDAGLKVDIRDSLYREDVRPGFVIEQFPKAKSVVKPGRKIFLYINAVHPKEVIIDDDNHPTEYALKGESHRSAIARLEERKDSESVGQLRPCSQDTGQRASRAQDAENPRELLHRGGGFGRTSE